MTDPRSNERARKLVVAGLVVDDAGRVLVTQRPAHAALPLQWEFPGGKLEAGESPEVGLARELAEELGVSAEVGPIWDVLFHPYPLFDLLMLVYRCRLAPLDLPRCLEVADLVWRPPDRLGDLDVLPADAPLVARLAREGVPPWPRVI